MKIAVLFGSFNPMTNAHITMMETAAMQLGADLGLFVATNGKYLRRKTVKINDPFYLTEQERENIITKVCEGHDKLAFWGFEMGGISPRRYKTLCKIQSEYPGAEIYEIQGADKLRSIPKLRDANDYIEYTRFAVFKRNDIDIDSLFERTPLLSEHKSAFTFLPPLQAEAEISSTMVRKHFYSGADYSNLIPTAAAETLSSHNPSDFNIDFADRMKLIMQSSRFGEVMARKEIYIDNAKLFANWQNGSENIDFGDFNRFLDDTKHYSLPYDVSAIGEKYPTTETGCINIDCVDLAEHLLSLGYNPAILNLASAKRPGGKYDQGSTAQEESLCCSSNLSLSLYQFANQQKLKCARNSGVPQRKIGYPFDRNFGGIYTPNVTFFRNGKSKFFSLREKPFRCDVISVAALSFNGRGEFSDINEVSYRAADGGFTPEGESIMLNKIRTILRMGIEHGKDSLILGAFGCGVYRLPIPEVVRLFRSVFEEQEFAGKFRLLVFAILEPRKGPTEADGKFADFYKAFGEYSL